MQRVFEKRPDPVPEIQDNPAFKIPDIQVWNQKRHNENKKQTQNVMSSNRGVEPLRVHFLECKWVVHQNTNLSLADK